MEDIERQLTACMLQMVSTLTLRSIKNTGMCSCFKKKKINSVISFVNFSSLISSSFFHAFQGCACIWMCISVSVRDLGMVPYIKIFLDEDHFRGPTLSILEQLAEINPDEFMSTAIGALCSSTQHELRLKKDLLQVR